MRIFDRSHREQTDFIAAAEEVHLRVAQETLTAQ
jgi:hypothetical protein